MSTLDRINRILKQEQTLTTGVQQSMAKLATTERQKYYVCPYCGYEKAIKIGSDMAYCEKCGKKFEIAEN